MSLSGMTKHPHLTLPGNHCVVHGVHRPTPARTVKHHIWPQEFGGPTIESNLVWVCDTGHYNIHTLLDALLSGKTIEFKGTRLERKLAKQGYDAIQEMKK